MSNTITNPEVFAKVLSNTALCKTLLETILDQDIQNIQAPEPKKTFHIGSGGAPELDIYTESSDSLYGIKLLTEAPKAIPKLARYYHAAIDLEYRLYGKYQGTQANICVIFICMFDPVGDGACRHWYRPTCMLSDGSTITLGGEENVFVNVYGNTGQVSEKYQALMRLFNEGVATDPFTRQIQEAIATIDQK